MRIMTRQGSESRQTREAACLTPDRPNLFSDQFYTDRILDQLRSSPYAQRLHDVIFMRLGGAWRDVEHGGHFFHGAAFGDQLQHLPLPRGQWRAAFTRRTATVRQQGDQVLGQQGGYVRPSTRNRANRIDQLFARRALQQVARYAGAERFDGQIGFAMHGEHDDPGFRILGADLPDRIEPVQQRHGYIGYDYVRMQRLIGIQQRASIVHDADQLKAVLEKGLQTFGDDGVIFGQEHSDLAHTPHRNAAINIAELKNQTARRGLFPVGVPNAARQIALTANGGVYRRSQLLAGIHLQNIASNSGEERGSDQGFIGIHRKHHNGIANAAAEKEFTGFDAVHAGHLNVGNDGFRSEFSGGFQE